MSHAEHNGTLSLEEDFNNHLIQNNNIIEDSLEDENPLEDLQDQVPQARSA